MLRGRNAVVARGRDARDTISFVARGRDARDTINRIDQRITQIPEISLDCLVLDFIVGEHGLRGGVPVDEAFASIY